MTANTGARPGPARPSPRRPAPRRPPEPGWAQPRCGQCHREASAAPSPARPQRLTGSALKPTGRLDPSTSTQDPGAPAMPGIVPQLPGTRERRPCSERASAPSIHSETCVRLCPPYSCSWAVFQRPPGSLGPQAGPGTEDSPAGRVLPQGPAAPPKGRADVRGSSIPLLNPPRNFKSIANKAQSP